MFHFRKKESVSLEIDKELYTKLSLQIATSHKTINEVVEDLILDYLGGNHHKHPKIDIKNYDDIKADYRLYLTKFALKTNNEHYSPNVARSYTSGINSSSAYCNKNLWNVTSSKEMKIIYQELMSDEEFIERDINTNKTFSNSLKRYIEYLEYKENK